MKLKAKLTQVLLILSLTNLLGNQIQYDWNLSAIDLPVTSDIQSHYLEYFSASNISYLESREILKQLMEDVWFSDWIDEEERIKALIAIMLNEKNFGNTALLDSVLMYIDNNASEINQSKPNEYTLFSKAMQLNSNHQYEEAFETFDKILKNDPDSVFKLIYLEAKIKHGILQVQKGEVDSALQSFREGAALSSQLQEPQYQADFIHSRAILLKRSGNVFESLKAFTRAKEILEKWNLKRSSAELYNNMASLYYNLGVDSISIDYFQQAHQIAKKLNKPNMLFISSTNLATYEFKNNRPEVALQYIKTADSIRQQYLKHDYYKSTIYEIYGDYYSFSDLDSSHIYYQNAYTLASKYNDAMQIMTNAQNLARIAFDRGKYTRAEKFAEEALTLSQKNSSLSARIKALSMLAEIDLKKGRNNKALSKFILLDSLKTSYYDSLIIQNNRNFAYHYEVQKLQLENQMFEKELQLKSFEVEKKSKEISTRNTIIVLLISVFILLIAFLSLVWYQRNEKAKLNRQLVSRNSEMAKLNDRLEQENDFKNQLFAIVSHDFRSPLANLIEIIQLLEFKDIDENKRLKIFSETKSRLNSTLNLIDNLIFWTKDQLSKTVIKKESFHFSSIIETITKELADPIKSIGIHINYTYEREDIIYTDKNSIHFVMRNLISNALKFTKSEGRIDIRLENPGITYKITVQDSGVGMSKEVRESLFTLSNGNSAPGLRSERGHGIGLYLCHKQITDLGGTIKVESKQGEGTSFIVELPQEKIN